MKTCALVFAIACLLVLGLFTNSADKVHGNAVEILKAENQVVEAKWSGSVTQTYQFFSQITDSHATLDVSFSETTPTMYRRKDADDPSTLTDNKGTGTLKSHADGKTFANKGPTDCFGVGPAELHSVIVNRQAGKYDIEVMGPKIKCRSVFRPPTGGEQISNYDADSGFVGNSITISQQAIGANPNVLTGSISESFTVPGVGNGTRSITWNLTREVLNAEFIITPVNYNTWLPEPGLDISKSYKGNVLEVELKVQRRGGGLPSSAVKRFELSLIATSEEPGITVNYPVDIGNAPIPGAAVVPTAYLPDLRFIATPSALSIDDDQTVKIASQNGSTGKAYIASYDGGAYSNLVGEAVLENGMRLKGHLLTPSGPIDVPIPKRSAGSKIGDAWLQATGNHGDMDDDERSMRNPFKGDGLTAYEEYRGVVADGQFKRLDPNEKDLGVMISKTDLPDLAPGITRFTNATEINTILFRDDGSEIGPDRPLNNNHRTAHDYDQFVLQISNASLTNDGSVWGRAVNGPGLPKNVTEVLIDIGAVRAYFVRNPTRLPTERDQIAQTTAHEIGHGVSVPHHGNISALPILTATKTSSPPIRIFSNPPGGEITIRDYPIEGKIGVPGNQASGDVNCIMTYNNVYEWVKRIDANGDWLFYSVPALRINQTVFCDDKAGTDINARNQYFGDAGTDGKCIALIKLRP
jgi:hypothetical protein